MFTLSMSSVMTELNAATWLLSFLPTIMISGHINTWSLLFSRYRTYDIKMIYLMFVKLSRIVYEILFQILVSQWIKNLKLGYVALSVYIFTTYNLKLQIYKNLIYNTRTNNFSTHNFYNYRCYMASSVKRAINDTSTHQDWMMQYHLVEFKTYLIAHIRIITSF